MDNHNDSSHHANYGMWHLADFHKSTSSILCWRDNHYSWFTLLNQLFIFNLYFFKQSKKKQRNAFFILFWIGKPKKRPLYKSAEKQQSFLRGSVVGAGAAA